MIAPWVQEAVAQFGRQLGLTHWEFDANDIAMLRLQSGGLITVEAAAGGAPDMLVTIGRPVGFDCARALRNALACAHHAAGRPLPVQVAVRGNGPDALLMLAARVPEREFTTQVLGRVIDSLRRWSDEALHG